MSKEHSSKVTLFTLIVTLGIVYGDIGTSPLYTVRAIIGEGNIIDKMTLFGGVSLIFWTLTLQTTLKYVIITLRADNNGEGGIFSLYTLVRKQGKWLIFPAIIGGAALLADSIITPAVTVTSSIEGLALIPSFKNMSEGNIVVIVLLILALLFWFQRFGTESIGKIFGPVMLLWFSVLLLLGLRNIINEPQILLALNPYYALHLLISGPQGILILGAVFLCTTGAEALYSDLGHCGRKNIYYSWVFVKISLVVTYLGQMAYLIPHVGHPLEENPYYMSAPEWFILPLIILSTFASIIASQALISGAFTLVSEASKLNLFPRLQTIYPTLHKGQLYIPSINAFLWLGSTFVVLYFRSSEHMEAAYGLSITITMLMTTLLVFEYLKTRKWLLSIRLMFLALYVSIEGVFLYANLSKFLNGGYVTVVMASTLIFIMVVWYQGYHIKMRNTRIVSLNSYKKLFNQLSEDKTLPKEANNLVYLSSENGRFSVEKAIIYSIFNRRPKRADNYWFIHVNVVDEPYGKRYELVKVTEHVFKVIFYVGFRENQSINLLLRSVIASLLESKELDPVDNPYSIDDRTSIGDFKFVLLEDILPAQHALSQVEEFFIVAKLLIKRYTIEPERWFGIDTSVIEKEKVPMFIVSKDIEVERM